ITCLIIFSGSSARSIMSLRFARMRVPTRSKSPMVILLSTSKNRSLVASLLGMTTPGSCARSSGARHGESLRMPTAEKCRGHFESDRGYKSESAGILETSGNHGQRVAGEKRQEHGCENPEDQKLLLECHLIPLRRFRSGL